jgi:hypothetical protein
MAAPQLGQKETPSFTLVPHLLQNATSYLLSGLIADVKRRDA